MGIINILDSHTADLIAAGEVVERPASAIKEMLENCADAGAKSVTVEIKNGGTSYIRVTDNGCGMSKDDLQNCILRHATSKIKDANDLYSINTLGFRGEALAAISAVCDLKIFTKRPTDSEGSLLECHFGDGVEIKSAGCPDGTTIIAADIFAKVPARKKFLKKDFSEAQAVLAVCEKFALSRPEISVSFISDSTEKLHTDGDGKLKNAISACLGRQFAQSTYELSYEYSGIRVFGHIGKPETCRASRSMQNFFVNGRFVKSRTMMAALEEGYRSYCPVGKFPSCVLFCELSPSLVDVNIHPAKTEIKFNEEKKVFDAVYFAVKNVLGKKTVFEDEASGTHEKNSIPYFAEKTVQKTEKAEIKIENIGIGAQDNSSVSDLPFVDVPEIHLGKPADEHKVASPFPTLTSIPKIVISETFADEQTSEEKIENAIKPEYAFEKPKEEKQESFDEVKDEKTTPFRIIGEAFDSYIIVERQKTLYLIDKHAAHERIIYEQLKNKVSKRENQQILEPIVIRLSPDEAAAVAENAELLRSISLDVELFGSDSVILRSLPDLISASSAEDIVVSLAQRLSQSVGKLSVQSFDKALYTCACKAAIKAGQKGTYARNEWIVNEIFTNEAVLYCPHGRPVMTEFSKEKLDKMFKRT